MKNSQDMFDRYGRQLILPEFGVEGQNKINNAKILIIGCGGLGSPAIQYLAAAGVGNLTLCDGDNVEVSNLNRQTIFREVDIGENKAICSAKFVTQLNSNVQVSAIDYHLGYQDIRDVIKQHDVILDCTDGLPIKFLINDSCVLENKILIHGAVTAYDGRLLTILGSKGPCLRCIFEQIPPANAIRSCSTSGILGPVCGVVGSFMAIEALQQILRRKCSGTLWAWDFLSSFDGYSFPVLRNSECKACGNTKGINPFQEIDYDTENCII